MSWEEKKWDHGRHRVIAKNKIVFMSQKVLALTETMILESLDLIYFYGVESRGFGC
jgi:hypothetical protein